MSLRQSAQIISDEVRRVVDRLDDDQAEDLTLAIQNARTIVVAGVGREGLAGRSFAMRLMHLGFDAHWVWDDTCPPVSVDDLLLTVSGSGEIGHLDHIVNMAIAAGSHVAVVTAVPTGMTAQKADHVLSVPAKVYKGEGELVPSVQPMGSLFEESVWICFDALVLELVRITGHSHAELSERHRNVE